MNGKLYQAVKNREQSFSLWIDKIKGLVWMGWIVVG